MKKLVIFFSVLFFAFPVFAGTGPWMFVGLTGGAYPTLDSIATASLTDGDFAMGVDSGRFYVYVYDASSSDAEDSPQVIKPDDNTGNGRFKLVSGMDFLRDSTSGDSISLREGSSNGDNYIKLASQASRSNDNTFYLRDLAGLTYIPCPYIGSTSSSITLTTQQSIASIYYLTGTITVTLDAVANLPVGAWIKLVSTDANTKTVDPNASDRIRRDDMTAQSDGVSVTFSGAGSYVVLVRDSASGWTVDSTNTTVSQGS